MLKNYKGTKQKSKYKKKRSSISIIKESKVEFIWKKPYLWRSLLCHTHKHLYLLFQSPIKQKSNMHVRDQTKLAVCIRHQFRWRWATVIRLVESLGVQPPPQSWSVFMSVCTQSWGESNLCLCVGYPWSESLFVHEKQLTAVAAVFMSRYMRCAMQTGRLVIHTRDEGQTWSFFSVSRHGSFICSHNYTVC